MFVQKNSLPLIFLALSPRAFSAAESERSFGGGQRGWVRSAAGQEDEEEEEEVIFGIGHTRQVCQILVPALTCSSTVSRDKLK
jgi:hypothetical protein